MLVIGLISGTSVDGIDAALVNISGTTLDLQVELVAGATYPYPSELRSHITSVIADTPVSMAEFAALDDAIAEQFAQAAIAIQVGHPVAELIGSHGQTVYHRPPSSSRYKTDAVETLGYSLQLGRGAAIAHRTGITTVSNFRAADIAAGGQGAPLVSALDVCVLRHATLDRCIQNIGGIGNVTYLPAKNALHSGSQTSSILGWDTGPGNTLLDLAVQHLSNGTQTYDQDGAWAATGNPCQSLVHQWLQQEFFQTPPPKSTGRELFSLDYLHCCLHDAATYNLTPADVLATLTEFTAASIAQSYRQFLPKLPDQVLICGGGSHNLYLKQRIQANLELIPVCTTNEVGLNADFKEAIAFAVLAYWRIHEIPGNLPEVTGARKAVTLGEIHLAGKSLYGNMNCHQGQHEHHPGQTYED
ncbi:MAG: anhydro-N-acetylmuramic acid kinase [Oculatellaceae cyanobacterium bins.114]|nr:anhydro-N-acetylmuramic acid kinase [Oculatellaceae cyanobacterium bins.114]